MTTTALSTAIANPSRADVVERAAQHMYDAEVTLHIAPPERDGSVGRGGVPQPARGDP